VTVEPGDVLIYLRKCGVVAHHATRMPAPANGPGSIVVFLEGTLGQFELARRSSLRIPGVRKVTFAGYSRAIMYVHDATPKR
jgi:hypothetical protein